MDGETADRIKIKFADEHSSVVKIKIQSIEFPNSQVIGESNCNVYFRLVENSSTFAAKAAYVNKVYHVKMPFGRYDTRDQVWAEFARQVNHVVIPDTGGSGGLTDIYGDDTNTFVDVYSGADGYGCYFGETWFDFYFLWATYSDSNTARTLFGFDETDGIMTYDQMGTDPVENYVYICSSDIDKANALIIPDSTIDNAFGVCQITENRGTIFINANEGEIASMLYDTPTKLRTLQLEFRNPDGTLYSFNNQHYSISFDVIETLDTHESFMYQSSRGV
jgi:hypothetical protein